MNWKKVKLFFIVCFMYVFYAQFTYTSTKTDFIDHLHKGNYKVVQLFTERFFYENWGDLGGSLGEEPFRICPENRCFAFKSIVRPYEKSDAVVVHAPNLFYMPSRETYKRDPKQIWVFFTMESQRRSYCSSHYEAKELDDWFNLTATFRPDSDLVFDYKPFRKLDDVKQKTKYMESFQRSFKNKTNLDLRYFENEQKQKTKFAVWFVSHCETLSRREEYVQELRKYIPIDIYGSCTKYFKDSKPDPCGGNSECMNGLLNSYKFYLSFENGLCDDYITEKVWKLYSSMSMFDLNIVPVVRGARKSQYERALESISYINADDYKSPRQLAEKLLELDSSSSKYANYFEWKVKLINDMHRVDIKKQNLTDTSQYHEIRTDLFCKLCSYLHNKSFINGKNNRRWIISEWFGRSNCWDHEYEPNYIVEWLLKRVGFCI